MNLPFTTQGSPRWRYAIGALIIILAASYFVFGRGSSQGATLTITPGDFREQVSVSGTVIAAQNVALGFAVNGRIAGTYASVGSHVGAGTVLAEIENGDLSATLAQKRAALASLLAGTRPEQVAVATATVASDKAKLVDALTVAYAAADDAVHNKTDAFFTNPRTQPKLSFTVANATLKDSIESERTAINTVFTSWSGVLANVTPANAALVAQQSATYLTQITTLLSDANTALSQALPDQTTSAATISSYATALATARTNVNSATIALTSAAAALTDAQKTLTLDQAGPTAADVAAAQAEVDNARANLTKTRVVAPFSGVVTRMDAKVGEIVSPSTSEIALQSDGIFEIETFVPEVTIARIAPQNPATTTLDAYGSSVTFPSVVISVDPAETVKDGVPTYKTKLAFLAADPRIRSGMTANVVMETGILHNAIVIPSGAITTKNGTPHVSLLEHGSVVARPVTTGPSPALGQAQVLSGLSAGDIILLTPAP